MGIEYSVQQPIVLVERKPIRTVRGRECTVYFYKDDPFCEKVLGEQGETWMLHGIEPFSSHEVLSSRVEVLQLIFDTIAEELGSEFVCPRFYVEDRYDGPVVVARQAIVAGCTVLDLEEHIFELSDPLVVMSDPHAFRHTVRQISCEKYEYAQAFEQRVIGAFHRAIARLKGMQDSQILCLLDQWRKANDRFPDVHFGNYHITNVDAVICGDEDPRFVLFDV